MPAPSNTWRRRLVILCVWLTWFNTSAAETAELPFRVAVISDINGSYGSVGYNLLVKNAIRRIVDLRPALVLITGDMIAGQLPGRPLTRQQLDESWQAFNSAVLDPLAAAGIPVAPSPGNHDAAPGPIFLRERQRFAEQWLSHKSDIEPIQGDYPFTYGFRAGPVLFVSVDATSPSGLDDKARRNLQVALEDRKHTETPPQSVVVFGHLPLIPIAKGREREYLRDPSLLTLLKEHGTTLYLNGHHHAFYDGCVAGIRQVSIGALAAPRALISGNARPSPSFVLLTWREGQPVDVQAFTGRDFEENATLANLPRSIVSQGGTIVRSDASSGCVAAN